jgi:hypothetical protein
MRRVEITSAKLNVVFPEGKLPAIDPSDPAFVLVLGGVEIRGKVNPKAARKLAQHKGGAVLQGRLIVEAGKLTLADAGFNWIEPKTDQADKPAVIEVKEVEVTETKPAVIEVKEVEVTETKPAPARRGGQDGIPIKIRRSP